MLEKFTTVSVISLASVLCFSGSILAANDTGDLRTDVSQQAGKLTGVVEDAFGPVAGASVLVKGTTHGIMTDMDGQFTLDGLKKGDTIQISFIGFVTQEIPYTGQTTLTVHLQEDTKTLDEVVVTALGMKRDKKALGYSMQELKGDDLLQSREPNIANSLSGKVSGLQIVRSSNGVGGSSKIVLRGNSSLTGSNQPLIVVDGTPMDNFTGGVSDVWGNSGADMGNGLSDINPEDIESMTVLKGASAAALYGSRAGNGVILITTKSGKKNEGVGITVTAGLTAETMFLKPEFQNVFGQGTYGAYDNQARSSWGPKAVGQDIQTWDGKTTQMRIYDNIDAFFKTGTSFNEGVSFQQNIKGASVFASVNRSDDAGITPRSNLDKTSVTLRATAALDEAEKWKIDAKANYINMNAHNRPIQGVNQSNAFNTIYTLPRSLNIKDFEDCTNAQGDMIWYDKENSPQENPYWVTRYRQNSDSRNRLLGNVSLKYQPVDWFNIELRAGTDYYTTTSNSKLYAGGNVTPRGRYTEASETFYENNYSFLTTAQKDNIIDKFGGMVTFGGNLMFQKRTKMNASSGDLNVPNLFSLNNGINNPTVSSTLAQRRMNSLYGSLQLNWDSYLFLDVTARNDWSSTMSKANRSYFYPSVSFSTVLTEMASKLDWKLPDVISFAKIRASFAEVGNDLDPYQLYNNYTIGKDPNGNSTAQPGSVYYNVDVRSELIKSWEAGADVRFFQNRLGIDFAWYKTNATRQLLNLPMDPFSGYSSRKINAGNIQNEGIELSINGDIIRAASPDQFGWNATVQVTRNKNKIISLYPGVDSYDILTFDALNIVANPGGDYGDIYGQTFVTVDDKSSPYYGYIVVNSDGSPSITENKVKLGNQSPTCMVGLTNNFTYKNFSLSFLIDMRFGGKIYSQTAASLYKNGNAAGTVVNGDRDEFVIPNSVYENSDGIYVLNTDKKVTPQNYWQSYLATGNLGLPGYFTYDATNIRLRNITLGYDFPKSMLKKTVLQRARLSVTCNNVWMIHYNLPGIDPESVSATNTNAVGFENSAAPTTRSYTFNVTVGF
jgi:TonB-linked SusC/RagA family outer membrane protein